LLEPGVGRADYGVGGVASELTCHFRVSEHAGWFVRPSNGCGAILLCFCGIPLSTLWGDVNYLFSISSPRISTHHIRLVNLLM
jgi:hypothetical protein